MVEQAQYRLRRRYRHGVIEGRRGVKQYEGGAVDADADDSPDVAVQRGECGKHGESCDAQYDAEAVADAGCDFLAGRVVRVHDEIGHGHSCADVVAMKLAVDFSVC